jgi:endonuclease YncB( thermonuclease family)
MNSISRLAAAVSALLCLSAAVSAATLQAKVTEVPSGNTLVVANINRSMRIRLKAIAPPESGQPYSDVARDHLRQLVLEKAVTVEYTHLADGYLDARVFLNGVDVGSQMLRDGVAWYDRTAAYELSQPDQKLYSECELAARTEKRGLWRDQSPLSPWEFRRIQKEKAEALARPPQSRLSVKSRRSAVSRDEFGAITGPTSIIGNSNVRPIAEKGSPDRWTRFDSPDDHFTVLIPSNAFEGSNIIPLNDGRNATVHFLAAGSDQAFYSVLFGKGPKTDNADGDQIINGLVAGMNDSMLKRGSNALMSVKSVRDLKVAGYSGRQYRLDAPGFSGSIRFLSKVVDEDRQFFIVFAFAKTGSEYLGNQFLNSFSITN